MELTLIQLSGNMPWTGLYGVEFNRVELTLMELDWFVFNCTELDSTELRWIELD